MQRTRAGRRCNAQFTRTRRIRRRAQDSKASRRRGSLSRGVPKSFTLKREVSTTSATTASAGLMAFELSNAVGEVMGTGVRRAVAVVGEGAATLELGDRNTGLDA